MEPKPGAALDALEKVVRRLPLGEVRAGQRQMALEVERVLSSPPEAPSHLAVAAGTGTGKSFAYLVPALVSGSRVVVATATKALQDQLALKDLPLVAEALERPVSWAVLKGRSNYLCRQRLAELEQLGRQERIDLGGIAPTMAGDLPAGLAGEQVKRLVAFSQRTALGDRSELDFEPLAAAWGAVSVSAEECPGAKSCASGESCFAETARSLAAGADVVVVNHHLLGADLASAGQLLPEHDALVVDEAHELEDTLASSLGVDLTAGRLRGAAVSGRAGLGKLRQPAEDLVDNLLEAATRFELVLGRAPSTRLPAGLGGELGEVANLLLSRLGRLESALRKASGGEPGRSGDEAQQSLRALLGLASCREALEHCLGAGEETVVWVDGGERRSLRSAPLDVSPILKRLVFQKMPVVLTSATLPPGLAPRLGADPLAVSELDVGSPFDFQSNGLIYCAVDLPDPRRSGPAEAHEAMAELMEAAGGRTLALFTSFRAMDLAAGALRGRFDWPLYVQGERPKPALLQAFSDDESSCLFATMGFWQGVDVPGAALSLVIIDRLPFPRPDDPLFAARREAAGRAGFQQVDLPRAATLLAQGAGRLIRSAGDRGVVAVLDRRLATASYSGYLVRSLPRMRRTRDRQVALEFLRRLAKADGQEAAARFEVASDRVRDQDGSRRGRESPCA